MPLAPVNLPVPPTIGIDDEPSLRSVIGPRILIVPWPWNVAVLLIFAVDGLVNVYVPASNPTGRNFFFLPNSGPTVTSRDRYEIQSPLFSLPFGALSCGIVTRERARIWNVVFFASARAATCGAARDDGIETAASTAINVSEARRSTRQLCLTRRSRDVARQRDPVHVQRPALPLGDVEHPGRTAEVPGAADDGNADAAADDEADVAPHHERPARQACDAGVALRVGAREGDGAVVGADVRALRLAELPPRVQQRVALVDGVAGARSLRLAIDGRDLHHDRRHLDRQRRGVGRRSCDGCEGDKRNGTPEHPVEVTPTRSWPEASRSRRGRRGSRPGSR